MTLILQEDHEILYMRMYAEVRKASTVQHAPWKKITDIYCATIYTQIQCNYWSIEDLFWRLGRLCLKIYTYNPKATIAPNMFCKKFMDIYCGNMYT
jgi:hypothetical protein